MSQESQKKLTDYFDEIQKAFDINLHDSDYCINAVKNEKDATLQGFWRRSLVRVFFASVESTTYQMKYLSLYLCEHYLIELSPMELSIIKEETFDVKENGEVNQKKLKIPTLSHLKFSYKILSKSIGQNFNINKVAGWSDFTAALEIRDKITHPKAAGSLEITDRQLKVIVGGIIWHNTTATEMLKDMVTFIKDKNSKIQLP